MGSDLQFLATTREENCRHTVNKYLHGYYTMQFMERGSIALAYDGRERILEGGWFWAAYPGTHIRFHVAPGTDSWFHRHVGFRGTRVQEWQLAGLWMTEAEPAPPGDFGAAFDAIIAEARRGDRWGDLRATNLLENLLITLAEARARHEAAQPAWLPQVLTSLTRADVFVPDYAQIAANAHMAESTLRRCFKAVTGVPPQEYVMQSRLSRARALLAETNLSVQAIAERLGYGTVAFFARQFKERVGVTPGVYRRSQRG